MAVVKTINTKTHSSKEIAEFSFKNADDKNICYCKQRMKSKLSLSSECVETKLCKPCTSFTSHLHSWCGVVWHRTLRVNTSFTSHLHSSCGMVWYRTLRVNIEKSEKVTMCLLLARECRQKIAVHRLGLSPLPSWHFIGQAILAQISDM